MIGTSIYISKHRLYLLHNAANILNLDESVLLALLLRKSRKLFGDNAITGRAVEYQRGGGEDYAIHHIFLSETDYEVATGRRYLFKVSVSLIFALSISRFLDDIIYEWTHNTTRAKTEWNRYQTNICYKCFKISHFEDISSETWHIPWPRE